MFAKEKKFDAFRDSTSLAQLYGKPKEETLDDLIEERIKMFMPEKLEMFRKHRASKRY